LRIREIIIEGGKESVEKGNGRLLIGSLFAFELKIIEGLAGVVPG
tara:strand:+ start:235 stop:369 length:135 start_codon:yes stop_codon:yes gene_type:complete